MLQIELVEARVIETSSTQSSTRRYIHTSRRRLGLGLGRVRIRNRVLGLGLTDEDRDE